MDRVRLPPPSPPRPTPTDDPLRIYLYNDGLTRFATVKYSTKSKTLKNTCIHLTNYSVNKKSSDFEFNKDANADGVGSKWSYKALIRHLTEVGVDVAKVNRDISDLIVKTIIASESEVVSLCNRYFGNRFPAGRSPSFEWVFRMAERGGGGGGIDDPKERGRKDEGRVWVEIMAGEKETSLFCKIQNPHRRTLPYLFPCFPPAVLPEPRISLFGLALISLHRGMCRSAAFALNVRPQFGQGTKLASMGFGPVSSTGMSLGSIPDFTALL